MPTGYRGGEALYEKVNIGSDLSDAVRPPGIEDTLMGFVSGKRQ